MIRIQVSLKISMTSAIHRIGWGHVVHVPCYPTGIYRYFISARSNYFYSVFKVSKNVSSEF